MQSCNAPPPRRRDFLPARSNAPTDPGHVPPADSLPALCRVVGGELEQIQLMLGHSSVQTTERYLGTKQYLVHAPNDAIKLKVAV